MMFPFVSRFPIRRPLLVVGVIFAAAVAARALPERNFETTRARQEEVKTMVEMLEQANFNRIAVNNQSRPDLGKDLLHDYMADLDPQRLFFLATDEEVFNSRYAQGLYYNLRTLGNLDAAFDIYVQFEKRVDRRINWIFDELSHDFDFTAHETYPIDRSKSAWPATQAEADYLWRRRLKFELLQDIINKKTIEEAKKNVRRRYEGMLKNLADFEANDVTERFLTSLANLYDPHSNYFSPESFEDFGIQMRLSLVGIGALLGVEDNLCVVKEVIPGGPADLSKQIHANDKIIAVAAGDREPVDIIGMKLRKVVELIRGEKGSKVRLTIIPAHSTDGSKTREVTIERDVVKLNSARAHAAIYQVPDASGEALPIGVITLPSFYGMSDGDAPNNPEPPTSATKDVAELIRQLQDAGIKALVLDLRNNGGGLLSEAVDLAGLFVDKGPVVQVKSINGDVQVDSDENVGIAYKGPLAVLVSRFSASAAEIVPGALQNYGRAVIIGDKSTHGKGSVQTLLEMKNFSRYLSRTTEKTGAAKLTIQKFYLPNGSSTQIKGVIPDIVLPSASDCMPVGESSLPHALAWDEIGSTRFAGHPLNEKLRSALLMGTKDRLGHLEEFAYLKKSIDWFKAKQDCKDISLNLDERRHEREIDDAFRKAMKSEREKLAKGNYPSKEFTIVPPLPKPEKAEKKSAEDDEDEDEDMLSTDDDSTASRVDIPLRESLRVMADAISLSRNSQYWINGAAPLTAQVTKNG